MWWIKFVALLAMGFLASSQALALVVRCDHQSFDCPDVGLAIGPQESQTTTRLVVTEHVLLADVNVRIKFSGGNERSLVYAIVHGEPYSTDQQGGYLAYIRDAWAGDIVFDDEASDPPINGDWTGHFVQPIDPLSVFDGVDAYGSWTLLTFTICGMFCGAGMPYDVWEIELTGVSNISEPSILALAGLGLAVLGLARKRNARKQTPKTRTLGSQQE